MDLETLQLAADIDPKALSFEATLFALIAAFLLGQAIAAVYVWTYRGMSYTRSYVQAIAIGSVVACSIMLATSTNIAAGIGVAGSLSALRLRIALRDPRDMVFIFAGFGTGVACGLHAYTTAIAATLIFCLAIIAMALVEFGQREVFEGLLRLYVKPDLASEPTIASLLNKHTARYALTTMREVRQGEAIEYAYQMRARRPKDRVDLVRALEALEGVDGVSLHYQDSAQEM